MAAGLLDGADLAAVQNSLATMGLQVGEAGGGDGRWWWVVLLGAAGAVDPALRAAEAAGWDAGQQALVVIESGS